MADNRPPRNQDPLDLAAFGSRRLLAKDDLGSTPISASYQAKTLLSYNLATSKGSSCPRFVDGLTKTSLGVFLPYPEFAGAHDSAGAVLFSNAFPRVAEGGEELQLGDKVVREGTPGIRLEPENLAEIHFAAPAGLRLLLSRPAGKLKRRRRAIPQIAVRFLTPSDRG